MLYPRGCAPQHHPYIRGYDPGVPAQGRAAAAGPDPREGQVHGDTGGDRCLADIGHREGIIDHGDSKIVSNLLRFNSLQVSDIMTPCTVMFTLQEAQTVDDGVDKFFTAMATAFFWPTSTTSR